jgi:hypothetical protein
MLVFILMYVVPTMFVGTLIGGSLWAFTVMWADLRSPTSSFWWRLVCFVGTVGIMYAYWLIAKTIIKYRVWLPWKNRYLTKPQVVGTNHGTMHEWEESSG